MTTSAPWLDSDAIAFDESDTPYEVVHGEYREVEPTSAFASLLANILLRYMTNAAHSSGVGIAVMEVLFTLRREPLLRRQPDVALVHYARWSAGPAKVGAAWDTVPNLAVEVVSPGNTAEEIDQKIVDYISNGVELVWVLYPESQRMYVYRSLTDAQILTAEDSLGCEALLPGFKLSISTLFAETEPPQAAS
ncbi:Uma2 family endonuclease [bacterium]|nr:Uma2 family endonuclease [bacterium]